MELPNEILYSYVTSYCERFTKTGNPVDALEAYRLCLMNKIEPPEDLRQFFLQCISLTLEGRGKPSMDKAFGITDATGVRTAFSDNNTRDNYAYSSSIIGILVTTFGFTESMASRLLFERSIAKGSCSLSAESYRRRYSHDKKTLGTKPMEWSTEQAANNFIREFLTSFDVPLLNPKDREKLRERLRTAIPKEIEIEEDSSPSD